MFVTLHFTTVPTPSEEPTKLVGTGCAGEVTTVVVTRAFEATFLEHESKVGLPVSSV